MKILSQRKQKSYIITLLTEEMASRFIKEYGEVKGSLGNQVTVSVKGNIIELYNLVPVGTPVKIV